ncbi:hypothetical protein LCGC14_2137760, partial [marine sediment metagenome]
NGWVCGAYIGMGRGYTFLPMGILCHGSTFCHSACHLWVNEVVNKMITLEARMQKLEDGCKYGESCLQCAHPECILYWGDRQRNKYLERRRENPHPLLIKFGSDINKKPGAAKFALIACYQCNRKRWVYSPKDIRRKCLKCSSVENAILARGKRWK